MEKENVMIYDSALGIDGTIPQLIDWAVRYDGDYTDEALEEISRRAEELGFDGNTVRIPLLVKAGRHRTMEQPDTLPYESMQLVHLQGFSISFSEMKEYGEVEIREENDNVLVSVIGMDDIGCFTAAGSYSLEEFMSGEGTWLEQAIGSVLYYGKQYDEQ